MKKPTPIEFPKAKIITADAAARLIPVRAGKYDEVVASVKDLKPGQAASFEFPKGFQTSRAKHGLTAALQARDIKAPKGYGFYKNIGVNGELIVSLRERNTKKASAALTK